MDATRLLQLWRSTGQPRHDLRCETCRGGLYGISLYRAVQMVEWRCHAEYRFKQKQRALKFSKTIAYGRIGS